MREPILPGSERYLEQSRRVLGGGGCAKKLLETPKRSDSVDSLLRQVPGSRNKSQGTKMQRRRNLAAHRRKIENRGVTVPADINIVHPDDGTMGLLTGHHSPRVVYPTLSGIPT